MRGFEMMPTVSIVAIKKKFAIAFRSKDRTGNDTRMEAQGFDGVADAGAGEIVKLGIANDSPFPDVSAANLKLRFHQDDHPAWFGEKRRDGRDQHARRD